MNLQKHWTNDDENYNKNKRPSPLEVKNGDIISYRTGCDDIMLSDATARIPYQLSSPVTDAAINSNHWPLSWAVKLDEQQRTDEPDQVIVIHSVITVKADV